MSTHLIAIYSHGGKLCDQLQQVKCQQLGIQLFCLPWFSDELYSCPKIR